MNTKLFRNHLLFLSLIMCLSAAVSAENPRLRGTYRGFLYPKESTCSIVDPLFYLDVTVKLQVHGRKVKAVLQENPLSKPSKLRFRGRVSRDGAGFTATELTTSNTPNSADAQPMILSGHTSNEDDKVHIELKVTASEYISDKEVLCDFIYSGLLKQNGTPNSPRELHRIATALKVALQRTTASADRLCKTSRSKKKNFPLLQRALEAINELKEIRSDASTVPGRIDRKIFLLKKKLNGSGQARKIRARITMFQELGDTLLSAIARARKAELSC